MKFHIIAAENNTAAVQRVAHMIKNAGHDVWDWTQDPPSVECASEHMSAWSVCIPNYNYLRALDRSCANADMVVYLGSGDFEAGRQMGIAHALDIPIVAIPNQKGEDSFLDELSEPTFLRNMVKSLSPPNQMHKFGQCKNCVHGGKVTVTATNPVNMQRALDEFSN